ncbi:MAG: hypothetical protein UT26_C0036G0017 [Microgenomates group bacterium GW2011_GWC1_39_12]|nr:MAG: hypothetical protein UT26_C0036G0017 [Microgenomates group bacterium GW2011_GWC1_39_12]
MKIFRITMLVVLLASAIGISGCTTNVVNIPAGFVGKMLTPTGWQDKWLEAGQVDLGVKNSNGTYNTLVLLEVTSTTVKESFLQEGSGGEDHRVLTQDGVPVSVDVYVRLMVPEDDETRTAILAQVTPVHIEGDPNEVKRIMVQDIYVKFAQPEVRGKIREKFASYENYGAVYLEFSSIPEQLGVSMTTIFEKNNVPLSLMSVSLSNVKPDEAIWTAMNQVVAAEAEAKAIATIGQALRDNPEYAAYLQWVYLEKIAQTGTNTVIIVDGSNGQSSSDYASAQYLYQLLTNGTANGQWVTPTPTPTLNP